ncbi:phosphopantetheine-binding protein [Kineosporia rhizophila]|uniref:acyl carrier protein n=1 Tax=Kineosporia TaxID=49184 RepID=UPI001E51F6C8|nr:MULTISPECIES: phosphopantetheine-binding protein [Kineosporia]MCE0537664.1 phosphopantetheine-binding protein [Kineosporia rhizophila]GLY18821.1 acyl carrier protein [Kineosporia sp. NBRC 101677]
MNNDQILDEIARQIRILMPGLDETVRMDTVFEELGMDSLTRVDLLSAAEMSFGIEVPDEEVGSLVRVQDLVDFVMYSQAAA